MASQNTPFKSTTAHVQKKQCRRPSIDLKNETEALPENLDGRFSGTKWSPLFDGIIAFSFYPPPGFDVHKFQEGVVKRVDECIDSVLYGDRRKRLPVFKEICPE